MQIKLTIEQKEIKEEKRWTTNDQTRHRKN